MNNNIAVDFEEVRPYNDDEVPAAIERISANIYFPNVVKYLFLDADIRVFTEKFRKIKTVEEFQWEIMDKAIHAIVSLTSDGLSHSGFEALSNEKNYMYISNHRDILLDSAILQILLHEYDLETSEITFGNNLMSSPFVIDIGKINKMFRIVRGGTLREIFNNSMEVSRYMRYAITQKHQSTWIAQRNGRAKDGHDATEIAVLKMFAMSSQSPFVPNLMELNITPIAISYEYEPCDFLKTRELYISRQKTYVKDDGEDLVSILHGINQKKGKIHLAICPPITKEELEYCDSFSHNDKFKHLAELIDKKVYSNYKLWKTNYIAYDLLNHTDKYQSTYSLEEKEAFRVYMNHGLRDIEGDISELETIFLQIYAYSVRNKDV